MVRRTALLLSAVTTAAGHATLIQPMSRAYMKKIKGGLDGKACQAGSCTEPWSAGGTGGYSPCGIPKGLGSDNHDYTTDEWSLDSTARPVQMTAAEQDQATLRPGQVIEMKVLATAHHMGHFVFGICPDASLSGTKYGTPPQKLPECDTVADPTIKAACKAGYMSPLDTYKPAQDLMDCFMGKGAWAGGKDGAGLMKRHEDYEEEDPAPIDQTYPERWYLPPDSWTAGGNSGGGWPLGAKKGHYTVNYKVPANLKCAGGKCLIHFFYWTANSCTGAGYNKYFNTWGGGNGYQPQSQCTGGKCAQIKMVPVGSWAMSGDWWHGPQYDGGSCDSRVDTLPTNTWSRLNPERFWNCADARSTAAGPPPPPPSCSSVTCSPRACQTGSCNPSTGTCVWTNKDGACSASCTECQTAQCEGGQCVCKDKADGTACASGTCGNGVCEPASPGLPPVDCKVTVSCTWSACSKKCGGGERTETCTQQVTTPASNGGAPCPPVPAKRTETCNTQACEPGSCVEPAVKAWEACTPQGNVPQCCPDGYVCCGNQWWATCRQTCSATEVSFSATADEGDSGSKVSSGVAGLLGMLAGLCIGGVGIFAVLKAKGQFSSSNLDVPAASTLGTASRRGREADI